MRTAAVAWFALATAATPASSRPAGCAMEIGPATAAALLHQCREVRSTSRGACAATRSCAALREEIGAGCQALGGDAPDSCEPFLDDDDDPDEDE